MKKDLFDITGMSCSACSSRIQKAVSTLNGVEDANVNLLKNNMTVTYDESSLEGMSCGHCTSAVEKALRTISGVDNVSVELASKQAVVEYKTTIVNEQLEKVVTEAGYQVVEIR